MRRFTSHRSASYNILKNLAYYRKHGKNVGEMMEMIGREKASIDW